MRNTILFVFLVIPLLLGSCDKMLIGKEPENTPKGNFDVLWKTLDENYAQFEVRHVNWDSLYVVYSSKINSTTTDAELWNIASDLILNLDDGHVNIFNKGATKVVSASKLVRTRVPDDFSLNLVRLKFIDNPKTIGEGYITYGLVRNESIGYIHIASFAGSTASMSNWAFDIDKAIAALRNCDAMIIDLRNNGGGLIVNENTIAAAFIDHPITYLYSQRKTGAKHNDLGEKLPVSVSPRSGIVPFTKKLALLTNRFTGSGGEYFTQIFKNLPYTKHIGDTTFGAFGEVTNMAQMPNGWTFRYPCTLTTMPDGKCPEGIGIIPDIGVENTKDDIAASNDRVLESAIAYLKQ